MSLLAQNQTKLEVCSPPLLLHDAMFFTINTCFRRTLSQQALMSFHLPQGHLSPELHNDHTVCEKAVCCLDVPEVVEQHRICPLQDLCQGRKLLPANPDVMPCNFGEG
jgi:hypothetical protein